MGKIKIFRKAPLLIVLFSMLFSSVLIAQDNPAPTNLKDEPRPNGMPLSMQPWVDPDDPNVMVLEEGWDETYKRRDTSKDPKREAGPINLQRYDLLTIKHGFPTYFGLPVALAFGQHCTVGSVELAGSVPGRRDSST